VAEGDMVKRGRLERLSSLTDYW